MTQIDHHAAPSPRGAPGGMAPALPGERRSPVARFRAAIGRAAHSRAVRRFRANRAGTISLGVVLVLVAIALLAPVLPLQDPRAQSLARRFEGPSVEHWLGTDSVGRDVFSRLIWSSQVTLWAAAQAVALAVALGVPLGLFAGYVGRWFDAVVSRAVDVLMSLPGIILALAIIAILGPGLTNAMIAIGVVMSPTFYRVARGATMSVKNDVYVEAARAVGCTRRRILFRHVLPNAASPLLVQASFAAGVAIVAEASLSFLGMGVQPPASSWGSLISDGYKNVFSHRFLVVPPAVAISLAILAFATLGDALRDAIGRDSKGSG